jgi:hypothetical protein
MTSGLAEEYLTSGIENLDLLDQMALGDLDCLFAGGVFLSEDEAGAFDAPE